MIFKGVEGALTTYYDMHRVSGELDGGYRWGVGDMERVLHMDTGSSGRYGLGWGILHTLWNGGEGRYNVKL